MAVRQDKQSFKEGVSEFDAVIGGVYSETLPAVPDPSVAAARITSARGLHVNLRRISGSEIRLGNADGAKAFGQVSPGSTATRLLFSQNARKSALLYNAGSATVYLGQDNTVTSSTGFPLVPGAAMEDDFSVDEWWGITAAGTGDIRIMEAV